MSRPSRAHDRPPVWAAALPTELTGFIAGADQDSVTIARAKLPVAEHLGRLGDPLDECLSLLSPKVLADTVWRLPASIRAGLLRELGIPPARRPSRTAAQHALIRLRRADQAKRRVLSQMMTVSSLGVLVPLPRTPFTDAELLGTLNATTMDRNLVRLAALTCWGFDAGTAALLRVALTETDLALRNWPSDVIDDIAAACVRFEDFCRARHGMAPARHPQQDSAPEGSSAMSSAASGPRPASAELRELDEALERALVSADAVRLAVSGGCPPAPEDLGTLEALRETFGSVCERIGSVLGVPAKDLPHDRGRLADALAAHDEQVRLRELRPLMRMRTVNGPPGRAGALDAVRRLASDLVERQPDGWREVERTHARALADLAHLVDAVSQERDDETVDALAEAVRAALPDPSLVNAALRGQLTFSAEPFADSEPPANARTPADAAPPANAAPPASPNDTSVPSIDIEADTGTGRAQAGPSAAAAAHTPEPPANGAGPGDGNRFHGAESTPGAGTAREPDEKEAARTAHDRDDATPASPPRSNDVTGTAANGPASSAPAAVPVVQASPSTCGEAAATGGTPDDPAPERDPAAPPGARPGPASDPLGLMADLLETGRFGLAHHLAATGEYREAAAGSPPPSVPAALACAEAARTDTGAVATHLRDILDRVPPEEIRRDRPALLLTAAAAARAAVLCGHGTGELLQVAAGGLADMPELAGLLSGMAAGSAQGLLSGPHQLNALKPLMHADTLAKASAEAAADELRRPRHLSFSRATTIATRWWHEDDGLIGQLLRVAATDDRRQVDLAATGLRALRKSGRLAAELSQIDEELRDSGGHRLEGAARTRLLQYARESLDLIHQWVQEVRSAATTTANTEPWISRQLADLRDSVLQKWPRATAELEAFAETADRVPAAAARAACRSLATTVGLFDNRALSGPEPDPVLLLNVALLRAPGPSLTEEGHLHGTVTVEQVTAAATTDLAQSFSDRLRAEDFGGARLLADTVARDKESPDEETVGEWFEMISREQERVRRELRNRIESLADRMNTAARYGRLLDPDRSRLDALLAGADIEKSDLGAVRRDLANIERELPECARKAEQLLSERLQDALRHSEGVVAAAADDIRRRIAEGDLATAEEYLINAQEGILPPAREDHDELGGFFPVVPEQLTGGITGEVIAAARSGGAHGPLDYSKLAEAERPQVANALQVWFDARAHAREATDISVWLRQPLRMIGIESEGAAHPPGLTATSHRRWIDLIGLRRTGDPLIPAFGSLTADRLRLLLVWEQADVRTILGWVRQDNSDTPVLVCLFGPLGAAGRRLLAAETTKNPDKPVIVLDDTALAFLGTRGFGRVSPAMRLLLPFATVNPYFPHANDSIPPEMFYGRRSERTALAAPHGTNLIYGGRQFGKSALLRATERHVNSIGAQAAVYVCLPATFAAGELDHVWSRIGTKLRERGIAFRASRHAAPFDADIVSEAVRVWLNEDPERRLLLLLDECDGFFDADAAKGFAHTGRLRDLMNDTGRRFKVVFAGLHQVQRFAGLPNQPLAGAHLGVSAAIGPLHPDAAYNLLCVPTEALGIRFEDDSLVHHVLTYCNYQPKLLQLAGKALVDAVVARRGREAPPYLVTKSDLETVLSASDLRNEVRKATRLTLELDSRYKLIALVMAHHAHETSNHTMTTAELRSTCQAWWSAGFHVLGREEFRALLEEMAGLGVLARDRDHAWRVRSSNVLRLLGTADEIEEELDNEQWSKITDLAAETSRPLLSNGRTSPLTARQTADVLGEGRNQLRIVLGTRATGVHRVEEAVRIAAGPAPDRFTYLAPTRIGHFRRSLIGRDLGKRHGVIVDDLTEKNVDAVLEAMNAALDQFPEDGSTRAVTIVTDASRPDVLAAITDPELRAGSSVVTLSRLSHAGLRSWATADGKDATFSTEADLRLLAESTGGWPMLLDWIEDEFAAPGVSAADACAGLGKALSTAAYARSFVEATAIRTNAGVLGGWSRLIAYNDHLTRDEMVTLLEEPGADTSRIEVVVDALIALDVLNRDPDGRWIPEPALVRAWHTLHAHST